MSECPQFQLMPQVVPIYQPQQPPPQPTTFPMPGQPIFSMPPPPPPPPPHFGYSPLAWSSIHQYPPPPLQQPAYDLVEDDDFNTMQQQYAFNNNNDNSSNNNFSVDDSQNEHLLHDSQHPYKQNYARNVSIKVHPICSITNCY